MDHEKLSTLKEEWQEFGLEELRPKLDANAASITEAQDRSIKSRKKLAEGTKGFRKLENVDKLKQFGSLLRSYQEEIDNLTRRSKTAENAYLSLYKGLANIGDPTPAIHTALAGQSFKSSKEQAKLEMKNQKLQNELEEFRREFQDIKNQEVTIKRLQEKVRQYELKMKDMIEEKVGLKERELQTEHKRVVDELQKRESKLRLQLDIEQAELKKVHDVHQKTQSQLLDQRTQYEDEQTRKQREVEMLADETERLRERLLMLEQELAAASARESQAQQPQHNSGADTSSYNLALEQKDVQILQTQERLNEAQELLSREREMYKVELSELLSQLNQERTKVQELSQQLEKAPTQQELENLQKQLEIFERLEYTIDDSQDVGSSVEKLLKEKSRSLETDNLKMKHLLDEKETTIETLTATLEKTESELSKQKNALQNLEEQVTSGGNKGDITEVLATSTNKGGDGMIQILCNQRDRYKNALTEEEDKRSKLESTVNSLRAEKSILHKDNVKLYEKIKYLQSYNNISQTRKGENVDLEVAASSGHVEHKYRSAYEESVNPFVMFHRKEKLDRYKSLNPAEKVTLRTGEFFLSHKYSRTFIFFYAIFLHLIVMAVLYYSASVQQSALSSTCPLHQHAQEQAGVGQGPT